MLWAMTGPQRVAVLPVNEQPEGADTPAAVAAQAPIRLSMLLDGETLLPKYATPPAVVAVFDVHVEPVTSTVVSSATKAPPYDSALFCEAVRSMSSGAWVIDVRYTAPAWTAELFVSVVDETFAYDAFWMEIAPPEPAAAELDVNVEPFTAAK